MLTQDRLQLLAKGVFPVMFGLLANVPRRRFNRRNTDTESTVAFLPADQRGIPEGGANGSFVPLKGLGIRITRFSQR